MESANVKCLTHGVVPAQFVCIHLWGGKPVDCWHPVPVDNEYREVLEDWECKECQARRRDGTTIVEDHLRFCSLCVKEMMQRAGGLNKSGD